MFYTRFEKIFFFHLQFVGDNEDNIHKIFNPYVL